MDSVLTWLSANYIEALGTIASIIYLYFSIKQKIWLWPLGLISSAFYVYIFFNAKIYADMGLQVYYVLISIYGWYAWAKANEKSGNKSKIKTIKGKKQLTLYLSMSALLLFLCLSQILIYFTDSSIPYIDAFTTALSIVATWMLAKRYIEHWQVWIVVDAISSVVYLYKGLYFTVFLYAIYTVMAVVGFNEWMKDSKIRLENA